MRATGTVLSLDYPAGFRNLALLADTVGGRPARSLHTGLSQ